MIVISILITGIICSAVGVYFGKRSINTSVQIAGNNSTQIQVNSKPARKLLHPSHYLNIKRVLAWDDLVPWCYRGGFSMWHTNEITSNQESVFNSAWNRIKNGKNFRYYIDKYEFDIAFDGGDFGWVVVNMANGSLTICTYKTGTRFSLPYGSDKSVWDYCPELAQWYSKNYKIAKEEYKKDMNL